MKNLYVFKKTFLTVFIAAIFYSLIMLPADSFAGDNNNRVKPHFKEAERLLAKRNALFSLDLDIQTGLGIANTNFDLNNADTSTGDLSNTSTKIGPSIGATLSVNFFGYGFTTGMQYSNKGFETSAGDKTSLNYFNIPLLFYFDFSVGQKIRVDGNFGPYFGLLLSQDDNPLYSVKNFDLGLTGNLQLAYMFNKYLGVLLGGKYEYGGLNNLGNNEKIKKITTSTINIYTGLKIEL